MMSVFCKKCGKEFIEIGIPASTICALCEAEKDYVEKADEQARKQRVIETARELWVKYHMDYDMKTAIATAEKFEQAAEKYLKGENENDQRTIKRIRTQPRRPVRD